MNLKTCNIFTKKNINIALEFNNALEKTAHEENLKTKLYTWCIHLWIVYTMDCGLCIHYTLYSLFEYHHCLSSKNNYVGETFVGLDILYS